MVDRGKVVREFIEAWTEPDLDRLVETLCAYVSEDAVMRQMPFAEVRGHEGLRRICAESLESMSQFQVDIDAVTVAGSTVFSERVDKFMLHGRDVAVPVLGVFEVDDDGKITEWRDYFDSRPLFATPEPLFGATS